MLIPWRSGIVRVHIGDDGSVRGGLNGGVPSGVNPNHVESPRDEIRFEERGQPMLLFCYKLCELMTLRLYISEFLLHESEIDVQELQICFH